MSQGSDVVDIVWFVAVAADRSRGLDQCLCCLGHASSVIKVTCAWLCFWKSERNDLSKAISTEASKEDYTPFSEKEGRTFGLPLNWGQNVRIYLTEFSIPMTMLTKIIFNEFWSFWAPYSRVPKWGNDRIYVLGARDLFWRLRKFWRIPTPCQRRKI